MADSNWAMPVSAQPTTRAANPGLGMSRDAMRWPQPVPSQSGPSASMSTPEPRDGGNWMTGVGSTGNGWTAGLLSPGTFSNSAVSNWAMPVGQTQLGQQQNQLASYMQQIANAPSTGTTFSPTMDASQLQKYQLQKSGQLSDAQRQLQNMLGATNQLVERSAVMPFTGNNVLQAAGVDTGSSLPQQATLQGQNPITATHTRPLQYPTAPPSSPTVPAAPTTPAAAYPAQGQPPMPLGGWLNRMMAGRMAGVRPTGIQQPGYMTGPSSYTQPGQYIGDYMGGGLNNPGGGPGAQLVAGPGAYGYGYAAPSSVNAAGAQSYWGPQVDAFSNYLSSNMASGSPFYSDTQGAVQQAAGGPSAAGAQSYWGPQVDAFSNYLSSNY